MTFNSDTKRLVYLYTALIIAALTFLLTSCSSTHKIKTSSMVKIDSAAENSLTKKGISTSDSTGMHQEDSSYQNDFGIEFDLSISAEDPVEKAKDLAGADSSLSAVHIVTVDGTTISSNKPMKSLNFKQAGKTKKIDLTTLKKKDSGQLAEKNKVVFHKEEKKKDKEVKRTGASPLIFISLGIALIAAAMISWKFGLFRRKKDDIEIIKSKIVT
jgi:hypothetical protein